MVVVRVLAGRDHSPSVGAQEEDFDAAAPVPAYPN
jgi:hypothetical protein